MSHFEKTIDPRKNLPTAFFLSKHSYVLLIAVAIIYYALFKNIHLISRVACLC